MRLFVAINFSESTRRALADLQAELKQIATSGRFVAKENLHLTLVFLGTCNAAQCEQAIQVVGGICAAPFPIEITHLAHFRREDGDVWWAGLRESVPLRALQRDLAGKLRTAGFSLEDRLYTPHITLARQVVTDMHEKTVPPFGETVGRIHLMKSEHVDGRFVYTPVWEKGLTPIGVPPS